MIVRQPRLDELTARTASFVDRVLRGAKPGDLPVEYPTRFELVVNLKIAKAHSQARPATYETSHHSGGRDCESAGDAESQGAPAYDSAGVAKSTGGAESRGAREYDSAGGA
jgi:hypothetical protein